MTTKEVVKSVRKKLQDDQYEAVSIIEALNWVQDEIFTETHTRIMETSDVLTASAGDIDLGFPEDLQTIISLYSTSPSTFDMMDRHISYSEFLGRFPGFSTYSSAPIGDWTDFGNSLRFSAPLLTDVVLPIDYIRKPVNMVRDNDVCEIPDNYKEIIVRGTFARILEGNEEYTAASNERTVIAPLMTTFKRREARGMLSTKPNIIRTNRRVRGRY